MLVPAHGHVRGRQEQVLLHVIATPTAENTFSQPKVINRPGLYIVCKNTCNRLIFEGFGKAELMHDFSPVADVSGPVSRLRWGVISIS